MGCLYMIDFPNGKSYVGITSFSAAERLVGHLYETARYGGRKYVGSALTKYAGQFTVAELVYSDDWKTLCALEKQYIAHYKTKKPLGYNLTDGGDGSKGLKWSDEQRAAASERLRGNTRAAGCRHSPEGLECLRQAMLGNKRAAGCSHTIEGRARIRASQLGNTWAKPKTLEHWAKVKTAQALRRARENGIPFSYI